MRLAIYRSCEAVDYGGDEPQTYYGWRVHSHSGTSSMNSLTSPEVQDLLLVLASEVVETLGTQYDDPDDVAAAIVIGWEDNALSDLMQKELSITSLVKAMESEYDELLEELCGGWYGTESELAELCEEHGVDYTDLMGRFS